MFVICACDEVFVLIRDERRLLLSDTRSIDDDSSLLGLVADEVD